MSELEKTIEELEAEVLAELEEAHGADSDAPKKGSLKSEPMQKVKKEGPPDATSVNVANKKAHVDADEKLPDEGDKKRAAKLPNSGPAQVAMQKMPAPSEMQSDKGSKSSAPGQMPMQKVDKHAHMEVQMAQTEYEDGDYDDDLHEDETITREDLVNHLYSAMEQMDDDQLENLYASAFAVEEEIEDDEMKDILNQISKVQQRPKTSKKRGYAE